MKRTFLFFCMLLVPLPTFAQWNYIDLNAQVTAFGVQDSFLFIAASGPVNQMVYRYTAAQGYVDANSGLDFTQGNITSFASLGKYLFSSIIQIYRSKDNGSNWVPVEAGGPVATNGQYLYGCSATTAYRSEDSGGLWEPIPGPGSVTTFATISTYIFAINSKGLWRSVDTGNHWSQLSSQPPFVGNLLTMGSLLLIVGGGKVIVSADSGMQWSAVTVDSAGTVPESVNCLATDGKNLFAGTPNGVFLSKDAGKTWTAEGSGLAGPNIAAIGVFDTFVAIDVSHGLDREDAEYTRPIPQMTDTTKSDVQEPPAATAMLAIFPNPLKNSAMITYTLPVQTVVSISVVDQLGRAVWVPVTGASQGAGTYSINFDGSAFPSGEYWCKLSMDSETKLAKIIIGR